MGFSLTFHFGLSKASKSTILLRLILLPFSSVTSANVISPFLLLTNDLNSGLLNVWEIKLYLN